MTVKGWRRDSNVEDDNERFEKGNFRVKGYSDSHPDLFQRLPLASFYMSYAFLLNSDQTFIGTIDRDAS
eukprot:CAMPEP_0184681848 /NCGR_PEP_ID=MMETSP0312-20130426/4845_1 /TAXON_ID=31354 /ORGANISM="Compsopogon coeruleus, Strain SAG 36.94" /LENGTH=68 /DNA_ID=CAMNT_0027132955 /DNA_START=244 /DNA_END=450 /DNA_ORIENTATION=+